MREEYIYNAFAPLLAPFGREVNAYKAGDLLSVCSPVPANGRRAAQGAVRQKRECCPKILLRRLQSICIIAARWSNTGRPGRGARAG